MGRLDRLAWFLMTGPRGFPLGWPRGPGKASLPLPERGRSELGCPLDDQFPAWVARTLFGLSLCRYSDTNLVITFCGESREGPEGR